MADSFDSAMQLLNAASPDASRPETAPVNNEPLKITITGGGTSPEPVAPEAVPDSFTNAMALLSGSPAAKGGSLVDQIPGNARVAPPVEKPTSVMDMVKGAGDAALGMGWNSIAQPFANIAGAAGQVLGMGDAEKNADKIMGVIGHAPATQTSADYTNLAGNALNDLGINALPGLAGTGVGALSTLAKPAISYALNKQIPTMSIRGNPGSVSLGQIGSSALQDIGSVIPSIPTLGPNPTPEMATLARKFEDIGGKVPLHSLSNNSMIQKAGNWIDSLPFSGSPREANKLVINQEVLRQIGGDPSSGLVTPESLRPAMNKTGAAIGNIYNSVDIPIESSNLGSALKNISAEQISRPIDTSHLVNGYINDINRLGGDNGVISGESLHNIDSKIGKDLRSDMPSYTKAELSDLQEALRDALSTQLSPEDQSGLGLYRKQYAIGKNIEPIVAKNGPSGIEPQQLIARQLVTDYGKHRMAMGAAGDMGDLANIGHQFLKGSSPSMLATGALGAGTIVGGIAGGIAALPKIATALGLSNGYNRLGPLLSSKIISKSLANAPETPVVSTPAPMGPLQSTALAPYVSQGEHVPDGSVPVGAPTSLQTVPNWTIGGNNAMPPDITPPASPQLGFTPNAEMTPPRQWANRNQVLDQQAAAQEGANRAPATGGQLYDLDPTTGRLRPVDQGLKGATPDVMQNYSNPLDSAVQKLTSGQAFNLSAEEKIAWNKQKTDLQAVVPDFNTLTNAQQIREAVANRERLMDLAESLQQRFSTNPTPRQSMWPGPKTRGAMNQPQ